LEGALPPEGLIHLRSDLSWLIGSGPIRDRASTPDRRLVMDMLVRDRVGVVPGRGGWHLHPLVAAFLEMHVSERAAAPRVVAIDEQPEPEPPTTSSRVPVRTMGGLAVAVDAVPVPEPAWPTAA